MNILVAIIVFAVLSGLLGFAIGVCSKIFKVEVDPRIEEVTKMLPGANCGGCGFPGCAGFANAIVENGVNPQGCKPAKAETIESIREYIKKTTGPNGEYLAPVIEQK